MRTGLPTPTVRHSPPLSPPSRESCESLKDKESTNSHFFLVEFSSSAFPSLHNVQVENMGSVKEVRQVEQIESETWSRDEGL